MLHIFGVGVGHFTNLVLGFFGLCWLVILALYIIGYPGYFFDKLLKSSFGRDIFLPFKFLFRKLRKTS